MSVFQTADGRWIVGGERSGSEYKGFLDWRDCVIQLTESGATERSIDYLNAFRDYALEHSKLGEPIMPPSVQIWISNNGATSAVQADDMSVDGNDFTICGIKWNGTSWDYSGAGQGSGGGGEGGGSGGEGNLIVTLSGGDKTADKTCGEIESALAAGHSVYILGATSEESSYLPVVSCIYLTEPLEGYKCSYFSYRGKTLKFNANSPSATEYPSFSGGIS